MLKIILMRHAAAQLEQYGKNDRDRTITMTGMHELDSIRPQLHGALKEVSLLYCSNVKRTRQTLEGIRPILPSTADIHFDDAVYQASADVLWHKIQTSSPLHKTIMIIGHNPSLANMVNAVDPTKIQSFDTCSVVVLETNVSKWHEVSTKNLSISQMFKADV